MMTNKEHIKDAIDAALEADIDIKRVDIDLAGNVRIHARAKKLRYLHRYRNRHGQEFCYLRRPGFPAVRLKGELGTPEFIAEYEAALAGGKH